MHEQDMTDAHMGYDLKIDCMFCGHTHQFMGGPDAVVCKCGSTLLLTYEGHGDNAEVRGSDVYASALAWAEMAIRLNLFN